MEIRCGLLGRKLGHSYSPRIHEDYFEIPTYVLFEKEPEKLEDFLKNGDFTGLNVTIPYKKAVIPYCAHLSPIARRLGAVNTIVRQHDGSLVGYNTDYYGFASLLARSGLEVSGKKCLVLGSGGASATVSAVLWDKGAKVVVISRSGENNYQNLSRHSDAALIVNATPVGMYPGCGERPVDISLFPNLEGVLDLIYNPAKTQLLLDAEARGLVARNGLLMLVEQARQSAERFHTQPLPDALSRFEDGDLQNILDDLLYDTLNWIFIGMPGCGKSTFARATANLLERPLVDVDALIEEKAGMSIPDIFASQGEAGFRSLETQVLREVCKKTGQIIATGGGCVTREENYDILRQNGILIWLRRDPEKLPTNGRPLSQSQSLREMHRVREPLYRRFGDISLAVREGLGLTFCQDVETLARILVPQYIHGMAEQMARFAGEEETT